MAKILSEKERREKAHAINCWQSYQKRGMASGISGFLQGIDHPTIKDTLEFAAKVNYDENSFDFIESTSQYLSDSGISMISLQDRKDDSQYQQIALPPISSYKNSENKLFFARRSVRNFRNESISFDELSEILQCSMGSTGKLRAGLTEEGGIAACDIRAYPSAGGLFPVQTIIVPQRVHNLSSSVYEYCSRKGRLIQTAQSREVQAIYKSIIKTMQSANIADCSAILLFKTRPLKSVFKYGSMGLRFVYQEIGSICQTINLKSAQLNISTLEFAAFRNYELNRILDLDGRLETITHAMAIGKADH